MACFRLLLVTLVFCVCALSATTTDAATGKLRFWIDRNGNCKYDSGEEVTNTPVYRNSRCTSCGKTDSTGCISISGLKKDDKIFCNKLVFSQPTAKGDHSAFADKAFDLYLDTDQIDSTGAIKEYKITQSDINTYNAGGTVSIRLDHSVFCWNLMIALGWDADNTYKDKLYSGLIEASRYMFDITDGQMLISKVEVRNKRKEVAGDTVWWNADVQIIDRDITPNSTGAVPGIEFGSGYNLHMTRRWNGSGTASGEPDTKKWYRTLVHELGHYLWGLKDEYQNGEPSTDNWKTYRQNHKDEVPDNYGLMDSQYDSSEMSSFNDYRNSTFYSGPPIKAKTDVTREIWTYDLSSGGTNRPCWLHVWDRFDNISGVKTNWKDSSGKSYGGACAIIFLPDTGNFTGRDSKGREKRETQDRDGPTDLVSPYGYPAMMTYTAEWPSSSAATEQKSAPAPRVSSSNSGGPHLINDCRITGDPGNVTLHPRVVSDETLLAPPTVIISPGFQSPTQVPMTLLPSGFYEGDVNIGAETVGSIDVVAAGANGQTVTHSSFQVFSLKAGEEATLSSPDNSAQFEIPAGILPTDALAVTMGSGNYPIPHPNQLLRYVTETVAFRLEDGVSLNEPGRLNWKIRPESIRGTDANTTAIYRYVPSSKTFQRVNTSVSLPGFKSISAPVYQGVFAALGEESTDNVPPGMILGLEATTPSPDEPYLAGNAVDLAWIATGDDGDSGRATRYYVWFNTQPFDGSNLSECMQLHTLDLPEPAGVRQERSFDLPDPDTLYYFAIQAEDEAGNVGPLSNVVSAKSWVRDTDGDGLSDKWETSNGFDPQTGGEQFLDPDGDGLTNLTEYQLKTDPNDSDTDGDELTDGLEVMAQTSPTDFYDPKIATAGTSKLPEFEGKRIGLQHVVVTASYDDPPVTYAQEEDSSAGIRLEGICEPSESIIEVIGMPTTSSNGERCLAGCVHKIKSQSSVRPMAMCVRSLGGGLFGLQPPVDGGLGLSTIGLLVRACGHIAEIGPTWFVIDDGSGVPVKCLLPSGVTLEPNWTYVGVTGISSCENDAGVLRRVIRVRGQGDITPY